MFLVKIHAPLAQLYNDKSVLECYHTAVYCHILRRLWPAVVENDDMKVLLTNSILSTDMGIHADYMEKLETLQQFLNNQDGEPTLPEADLKKYRNLACNLLIKCADISNVVSKDVFSAFTTSCISVY